MNKIMSMLSEFFSSLDLKLIIAGFGVILIFALIVYVLIISLTSLKVRREAIKVSLPNIDTIGQKKSNSKAFREVENLSTELVTVDKDANSNHEDDKSTDIKFMTALSIEAKKYIPLSNLKVEMPEVSDSEYISLGLMKPVSQKKDFKTLKDYAREDNEFFVDKAQYELLENMRDSGGNK